MVRPWSHVRMQRKRLRHGDAVMQAAEMQCSFDEDGAMVKQRSRPMGGATVMQRCNHEDKAVVMQKSGVEHEAEVMQ